MGLTQNRGISSLSTCFASLPCGLVCAPSARVVGYLSGAAPSFAQRGEPFLGRAAHQQSLRAPHVVNTRLLSRIDVSSARKLTGLSEQSQLPPPCQLRQDLEQAGYVLLENSAAQPATAVLKTAVSALRAAHAPQGRKAPYDRIYIRWQRQFNSAYNQNTLKGQGSVTPLCPQVNSPWILTDVKNCDKKLLLAFQEHHALFDAANTFFDALHAQIREGFPDNNFLVTEEVRYVDPLDHAEILDTDWHCDQAPTYLTATSSWLGPGTIYLSSKALADIGHYPLNASELRHVNGSKTPNGAAIAFFGESGATDPLWHKSPKSSEPRILLIYRLSHPEEAVSLRPSPNAVL